MYVLEFGIGHSTAVMALAMYHLRWQRILRHRSGTGIVKTKVCSVDNEEKWMKRSILGMPEPLRDYVKYALSRIEQVPFEGDTMLQYNWYPEIVPNLIYVDGPNLFTGAGKHFTGTVDLLYLEPKLRLPCRLVVDGRKHQIEFYKKHFKRKWEWEEDYYNEWSTAVLKE
jgi:hypothetical protein